MKIHISYKNPISHILAIRLTFEGAVPKKLQLPSWRPGRYELQNFAQNITNINFSDGERAVTFTRKTKDLWVTKKTPKRLVVTYDYYAKQMDAGGTWLDNEQLYINFVTCVLQPLGLEKSEIEIELDVPLNYKFATSLHQDGVHLFAKDYYELVDSPVISSAKLQHHRYEQRGCTFHLWVQGKCEPDFKKMEIDFRKYGEEQISLFGEFPCENYHYLFQILPNKHYHGVEHSHSTVISLGPGKELNTEEMQTNLLGISSHELFHTWNVCRIKPKEFLPHYDYSKENYYETGYITEGITTYYGDYMLGRSGVFDTKAYFKEIDLYLKRHFENGGRLSSSLTDSSFKLWLDGYKLGVPNSKSSIYIKGALSALVLDLEIRKVTRNKKCLDDVMRKMWSAYGDLKEGYTHKSYRKIIEEVTETNFKWYFDHLIMGTRDIYAILNDALEFVGCHVSINESKEPLEKLYGFRTIKKGKHLEVVKIAVGSPASKYLDLGDELIEINQVNATEYKAEEQEVILELVRLNEKRKIILTATERTFLNVYRIEKIFEASTTQKNAFEHWLKTKF